MKAANKIILEVKTDFSATPGPRYIVEGDFSGELFRREVLVFKINKAIQDNLKLLVDLDGTAGYGTSFLEEAFGGLIRDDNISYDAITSAIEFKSDEEEYLIEDIQEYLKEASNEK